MSAKVVRIVASEPKLALESSEARAAASYLRRRLCAAELTQEQAARLVGREGRQVRRWLAHPPPVLVLLAKLENHPAARAPLAVVSHGGDEAGSGSMPEGRTNRRAA